MAICVCVAQKIILNNANIFVADLIFFPGGYDAFMTDKEIIDSLTTYEMALQVTDGSVLPPCPRCGRMVEDKRRKSKMFEIHICTLCSALEELEANNIISSIPLYRWWAIQHRIACANNTDRGSCDKAFRDQIASRLDEVKRLVGLYE